MASAAARTSSVAPAPTRTLPSTFPLDPNEEFFRIAALSPTAGGAPTGRACRHAFPLRLLCTNSLFSCWPRAQTPPAATSTSRIPAEVTNSMAARSPTSTRAHGRLPPGAPESGRGRTPSRQARPACRRGRGDFGWQRADTPPLGPWTATSTLRAMSRGEGPPGPSAAARQPPQVGAAGAGQQHPDRGRRC